MTATTEATTSTMLDAWHAGAGNSLEPSQRHFKNADASLKWTWQGAEPVRQTGLELDPSAHGQAGVKGWIYSEEAIDGRLTLSFGTAAQLDAHKAPYAFRFGLNFTGWRCFQIQFEIDAKQGESGPVEAMEIHPPAGIDSGTVYLDVFEFSQEMAWNRSADYQVPEYPRDRGQYWQHWPLYYMQLSPSEPLPEAISAAERADLARIAERYETWLLGPGLDRDSALGQKAAADLTAYVAFGWEQFRAFGWEQFRALGLAQDADAVITGPPLRLRKGQNTFHHVFYNVLFPLVFDYKRNNNQEALDAALLVLDYTHDQGWAEGSAMGSLILNCLVFAPFCHTLFLLRDELRARGRFERLFRAALWYLSFGKTFSRFDEAYLETNADELRSTVFTSLVTVLALEDGPQKVQYLRGWLNQFESSLEVSPRFAGVFKPDGLGWHHRAVYAGAYATEAYDLCALAVWLLHDTAFATAPHCTTTLKKALETQATLTHKYDVPYTTMGRMPRPGLRLLSAYAYLALSSEPADPELAGIFMRLWDPSCPALDNADPSTNYILSALRVDLDGQGGKFQCRHTPGRLQLMHELAALGLPAAPNPEGFWPLPWGALAIHRRDDWMVAIKGYSQYVWDFEMHPKCWAMKEENVYSRYWSDGTIQPLCGGNPVNPVDSGWNLKGGWDWCRWPGATTKHLSLEENYDPSSSWATRFFSAATFVGAVSSQGENGLFALKLHEHHQDPSFRAFKTVFCFGNELICLGSNIENRDEDHATETTLFQCWMAHHDMPMEVNGEAITALPYAFDGTAGKPVTLLDPYGNGYVVPDSGGLHLQRAEQVSRDAWNQDETRGLFSTCWIDHGTPPRDRGYGEERYHYTMLMQTTPDRLAAYAEALPYEVLMHNHQAHILRHEGEKTTAYALFETDWVIPHGPVRSNDVPVMVMAREKGDRLVLSLADPDLRLPKRRNLAYLDPEAEKALAKPSTVQLQVRGEWRPATNTDAVRLTSHTEEATLLAFQCRYGLTVEVELHPA